MKNSEKYSLTIGWLYPELMSTYGDRGNITVLQKRCEWRGIKTELLPIDQTTAVSKLKSIDLLFGGGAQDKAQEIVMQDLTKKAKAIKDLIDSDVPALFVCGAPQLMGNYYEPAEGKRINGLGIFDMVTKHPGEKQDRLIGNLVAHVIANEVTCPPVPGDGRREQSPSEIAASSSTPRNDIFLVGFENHGGRSYLGKNVTPLAKVIKGFGNNGEDGTEGVVYKNALGCYLHGPLLPKNPVIADFLIAKALEVKYKKEITLEPLDDSLEEKAQKAILHKLGVEK